MEQKFSASGIIFLPNPLSRPDQQVQQIQAHNSVLLKPQDVIFSIPNAIKGSKRFYNIFICRDGDEVWIKQPFPLDFDMESILSYEVLHYRDNYLLHYYNNYQVVKEQLDKLIEEKNPVQVHFDEKIKAFLLRIKIYSDILVEKFNGSRVFNRRVEKLLKKA